jgi:dUTP pyrophosphatase
MNIFFKREFEDVILPRYNNESDAGMDVFANHDMEIPGLIKSFFSFKKETTRRLVRTGISLQGSDLKPNKKFYLRICDTSGNAFKIGVHVMGGCIDQNYRGIIGVVLLNTNLWTIKIKKNDKIAQMIAYEIPSIVICETKVETETERGDKGFGSSGTISAT